MFESLKAEVKGARKCENINDPFDTHVVDYIAMAFSKIFVKLHIIPNIVTAMSGIVGITGGILLCFDTLPLNILGAILVFFSAVFDASDGQVARMTKRYSNFGRTLDGLNDFLVYLSMYTAVCVRLFHVNIPFTETEWRFFSVPLALIALFLYIVQSSTADYYKNMHIFMVTRGKGGELSRTANIKEKMCACKKPSFEHFRLSVYRIYTCIQEDATPEAQKMLKNIEENGEDYLNEISGAFLERSKKYVKYTNFMTFNFRTAALFLLLFLPWQLEFLYFPFVIFILEPIRLAIISTYEKLAKDIINQKTFAGVGNEK
ncbi:MAG: CDP-alcohol phosphatidyltransferase family protein [Clostridia bacterium]|nr:CDP-alcohol phosphatidyltransferase family protein [Clostridia bacterium]